MRTFHAKAIKDFRLAGLDRGGGRPLRRSNSVIPNGPGRLLRRPFAPDRWRKIPGEPPLADGDLHVAAVAALGHVDLGRDALAKLGDVADDADDPAARPQPVEGVHHLVEGLLLEG